MIKRIWAYHRVENSEGAMVERLKKRLDERRKTWDKPYPLSFSIGVAYCSQPEKGVLSNLLTEADSQMYKNKKSQRGQPPAGQ